ncbi:polyprenyl synthetase family protein [Bacillus fonticola]|uniref:polyprenyl synthetase family protein n=1 Tax=Bacillus fonticola TaxID=2728853 RepID=UPI002AD45BAA|nr:farnesyl diphosphate synthase [Bacillus fonticola]
MTSVKKTEQTLQEWKEQTERFMLEHVQSLTTPSSLQKAMLYSLQAGGKRIRPLLLLATVKALGKQIEQSIPVAAALEMIHTYSLIHDDLPSMDDDDLRRGKPTNHKVFGEATAILAGDALLTQGFSLVAQAEVTDAQKVQLISAFSDAAGAQGMVAGQIEDMEAEKRTVLVDELQAIHRKKTGRLLTYAVEAGCILAEAEITQKEALVLFSHHLGLAFQIQDDILDVEGNARTLGKNIGSDMVNEKSTYPGLLGLEGAKAHLHEEVVAALRALEEAKVKSNELMYLAQLIQNRQN